MGYLIGIVFITGVAVVIWVSLYFGEKFIDRMFDPIDKRSDHQTKI